MVNLEKTRHEKYAALGTDREWAAVSGEGGGRRSPRQGTEDTEMPG